MIGHSDTADLILEDRFVSRRHALVTVDPAGAVTIRDLNSTGGTFVNDERLTGPRVLQPGDIGPVRRPRGAFRARERAVRKRRRATAVTQLLNHARRYRCRPPVEPPADPARGASGGRRPWSPRRSRLGASGRAPRQPARAGRAGDPLYTVTGTVTSPALPGVAGLTVQLVDKNVGGDQVLATTQTGSDGSYSFTSLAISLKYLLGHHKTQPDLQAQVLAGGQFLAASPVSYSAPTDRHAERGAARRIAPGLPSEYETLTANLARPIRARSARCRRATAGSDITYLANKTGWDARAVALAALADQFSQITAPADPRGGGPGPDRRPGRCRRSSLRPEFYYALFRAGLPASADTLFQADPGTVQAIWQQATAQGVIPQALAEDVPAAVQSFQALSAARVADRRPAGRGVHPAGDAAADAARGGAAAAVRPALRAASGRLGQLLARGRAGCSGPPPTAQLQLTGQLYYLTVNNQPLVSALLTAEASAPLTSAQDLAARGYYDAGQVGAADRRVDPAGHPRRGRRRAGRQLRAAARGAGPHRVPDRRPGRSGRPAAPCPSPAPRRPPTEVAGFLTANQGQFEIGAEPVEAYLARTGLTGTARRRGHRRSSGCSGPTS